MFTVALTKNTNKNARKNVVIHFNIATGSKEENSHTPLLIKGMHSVKFYLHKHPIKSK